MIGSVSLGLPGGIDHGLLRELAPLIERLGFRALWLNDTSHGDSLAGLAVAASVTSTLTLATGVIPLDRRPTATLTGEIARLPAERLEIGIGSGGAHAALHRVREGIDVLRAATDATILVGALGPKMRALGAEHADGLLLNWLTPPAAADAVATLRSTAPHARAALYARTIVATDARPTLEREAATYASYPTYAANLARIGADILDTTIDGTLPGALRARVTEYLASVDELVLRAIVANDSDLPDFVAAAASALHAEQ
ncbi:alkanesulfonate monooxygenase SsuD/methylene tetrahydromethanopterin reductase-like flavin-dependent oxidoreductase (luciferase family) [Leifsonia sp. AK011]|uniref:LLM class flavin-dependent oxidoreductase n=1 Tax=Leifsonia sp. AK011 TaxID=2723075 RepID=UPI0015CC2A4F|nr:LLM class flavin-dependent oxidoreductase [Leifsonia sp. AK011]NYF09573.1 alkanesulfonate monooxygenase SsuD/methylene tetrahydromethanopterin reductase-like flavin-dependent oxidoreductase (luciferase family) [Leifsonia sp. AK011]